MLISPLLENNVLSTSKISIFQKMLLKVNIIFPSVFQDKALSADCNAVEIETVKYLPVL